MADKPVPFGEHPTTHEVVSLLLKRMEMHPEEFLFNGTYVQKIAPRRAFMNNFINRYKPFMTPAEKHQINMRLRDIALDDAYRVLNEELLK